MPVFDVDLDQFCGKNLLIYSEPDFLDFTTNKPASVKIVADDSILTLPLEAPLIKQTIGILRTLSTKDNIIIGWNLKNIYSYCKAKAGLTPFLTNVYDLSLVEYWAGIEEKRPIDFAEAYARLKKDFGKFKPYWQAIYKPLALEVLPSMESVPLANSKTKKLVYSSYKIDGTPNGRMKSGKFLSDSYNPHGLTAEDKECLKPIDERKMFVYFDFKSHEAIVLQWLSQDKALGEIVKSGRDVYEGIWEKITGVEATPANRKKCKACFLPVVFGMGVDEVRETLNVSEPTAKKFRDAIYNCFPNVFSYVNQEPTEDGYAFDYFGRRRPFREQKYKIRNFLVQSAAAVVCLHFLVQLSEKLKNIAEICFHVHDGFCILVDNEKYQHAIYVGLQTLHSQTDLFPNLQLTATAHYGRSLNSLTKNIW
jgi:hypothetical protein